MGKKGFQIVLTALRLHSQEQNPQSHPGRVPQRNPCPSRWVQMPLFTALSARVLDSAPCGSSCCLCCSWQLVNTTAASATCAKAFSTVPASLCHHVLSQSPAWGHLPGGASGCFNLPECLEAGFSLLWKEVVSTSYQDLQVWNSPNLGRGYRF